jgi:hypothetical protein
MKVALESKEGSLAFPAVCACCGEPTQSKSSVSHVEQYGSRTRTRSWQVPYCEACAQHRMTKHWGLFHGLLILFTLGLYYLVVYKPFVAPKRLVRGQSLRKQTCNNLDGVTYTYASSYDVATKTPVHRHEFAHVSEAFAKGFASGNPGTNVS